MTNIEFEVQTKCNARSDRMNSVKNPSKYPCFVLNHNDNWNDYGCYTWYSLFYFRSSTDKLFIGELKIMNSGNDDTNAVLPRRFKKLTDEYCSLGITSNYYYELRRHFSKEECEKILLALQDCAIQIEQYEHYKDNSTFQMSLVRELSSERARREAKYIIHDISLSDAYDIQYLFHPKYNRDLAVPFRLKYNPQTRLYDRCAGIIGENGVGKTTMLGGMIDCLINHKMEFLQHDPPLFSCVMAVCTTPFDSFSDIKQREDTAALMPYYYFCVEQNKGDVASKIKDSVKEIRSRRFEDQELFEFYNKFISMVLPEALRYTWWYYKRENDVDKFYIDDDVLKDMLSKLSSGQLHLFMLITFIFRKVNYDALIVIDEPEVHLHPKAIGNLFRLLAYLLDKFQGYCIVSTHSPLIVRELSGKNVYLMRRQGDDLSLGKIGIETLGEDISTLYEEIFGYSEDVTSLAKMIKKYKKEGKTYKEIVKEIRTGPKSLSLNARMLIKQILDDEES